MELHGQGLVLLVIVVSLVEKKGESDSAVQLHDVEFKTTSSFNVASAAVIILTAAFYIAWW